jgi:molybdate transport system substrate-binding protein
MKNALLAVVASALIAAQAASAAEIKLLASGATKEICLDLIPSFEKNSGHKVVATWAGTVDVKKKIAAGEVYDVVIVAAPEIDAFIKDGKLAPGSRSDLMKSAVGVAIRAGARKPDISSAEALKKTLLDAKSIGYSTGPSGIYIASLLEKMGIAEQVKSKLRQTVPGQRVSVMVASGDAEIGFQQVSELIHEAGIDYIGPLPAAIGNVTTFSAGIHREARHPGAGTTLVQHLKAPSAASTIKKYGMDPAAGG